MDQLSEIANILARLEDKELIQDFLTSILTPSEIKNISLRWELVKRLYKGISQRKIAGELYISLCKITRGSKELKKEDSALKRVIQEYNSWDMTNDPY